MPLSLTTRRKLISVAIAMAIFAALGAVTTAAVGRPVEIGTTNAVLIGLGVGLFEEFYVQSTRGNWLRAMHPLRSIPVYVLVVIVLYFVAVHISHLLLNRLDDLPVVYRRLPYGLTFFTLFSIVGPTPSFISSSGPITDRSRNGRFYCFSISTARLR